MFGKVLCQEYKCEKINRFRVNQLDIFNNKFKINLTIISLNVLNHKISLSVNESGSSGIEK